MYLFPSISLNDTLILMQSLRSHSTVFKHCKHCLFSSPRYDPSPLSTHVRHLLFDKLLFDIIQIQLSTLFSLCSFYRLIQPRIIHTESYRYLLKYFFDSKMSSWIARNTIIYVRSRKKALFIRIVRSCPLLRCILI